MKGVGFTAHQHRQHTGVSALTLTGQRRVQYFQQQIPIDGADQLEPVLHLHLTAQQVAQGVDEQRRPLELTAGSLTPERRLEQP